MDNTLNIALAWILSHVKFLVVSNVNIYIEHFQGAAIGYFGSIGICSWLVLGQIIHGPETEFLPLTRDGCNTPFNLSAIRRFCIRLISEQITICFITSHCIYATNEFTKNTEILSEVRSDFNVGTDVYGLSYCLNYPIGVISCLLLAVIVSLFGRKYDTTLTYGFMVLFMRCWQRWHFLLCNFAFLRSSIPGNSVGDVDENLVNPTAHRMFTQGFKAMFRKKPPTVSRAVEPTLVATIEPTTGCNQHEQQLPTGKMQNCWVA